MPVGLTIAFVLAHFPSFFDIPTTVDRQAEVWVNDSCFSLPFNLHEAASLNLPDIWPRSFLRSFYRLLLLPVDEDVEQQMSSFGFKSHSGCGWRPILVKSGGHRAQESTYFLILDALFLCSLTEPGSKQ